jgi:hypothetical protein
MATATDTLKIINTPDNTKVIKVQEGSLPGQKGDTPDKSIYSVRTVVADSPSLVIDASLATTFYIKLQASVNLTVINWPNDSKSQRIALYFEQDENGERNVLSWPEGSKWSYGTIPVLTPIPNAVDCIVLDTFNSGVTIFGGIVGLGYS